MSTPHAESHASHDSEGIFDTIINTAVEGVKDLAEGGQEIASPAINVVVNVPADAIAAAGLPEVRITGKSSGGGHAASHDSHAGGGHAH